MKKYIIYVFTLLLILTFCIFINLNRSYKCEYAAEEFNKLSYFVAYSDWFFEKEGFWPSDIQQIINEYPELKEYIKDYSVYLYTPFNKKMGYGKVMFAEDFEFKYGKYGTESSNVSIRFPVANFRESNFEARNDFEEWIGCRPFWTRFFGESVKPEG